jgi:hypothetical protein
VRGKTREGKTILGKLVKETDDTVIIKDYLGRERTITAKIADLNSLSKEKSSERFFRKECGRLIAEFMEPHIDIALKNIAEKQSEDGSWSVDNQRVHKVYSTGLAMLCFLGYGHTHRAGPFKKAVGSGLNYLLSAQDEDGKLAKMGEGSLRDQAVGTWALAECFALTRADKVKNPAQRAAKVIADNQNPDGGWGWKFGEKKSDAISTAFAVVSLKAAKTAGFSIPEQALKKAADYFGNLQDKNGIVGFQDKKDKGILPGTPEEFKNIPLCTAASYVFRVFCGTNKKTEEMKKAAAVFLAQRPEYNSPELCDSQYIYFFTYSLFQIGGKSWSSFQDDVLLWLKEGFPKKDRWEKEIGSIGVKAFRLLALEVAYRSYRFSR